MVPNAPTPDDFADHALRDIADRHGLPEPALDAVLEAHRLLGLTLGAELAERRNHHDPLQNAVADEKLDRTLLHAYQEIASILVEHVQKIHRNHRAHYSPELRFRILRVKSLLGWTQKETAGCFDVASNTVARWEAESRAHPEKETIGSLVKPQPPVRRLADVVRHLIQTMAACGFGGNERIAQTLARAGWKLAAETVRRIRKEKPATPPEASAQPKPIRSVTSRYPNHVTMADLTEIPSLFRLFSFKLAVIFDVFSRFPLAARVFSCEPSGSEMAGLFREAAERFGSPKHFVSDRGSQFTSDIFQTAVQDAGVSHRFGALGKVGSIALVERFWKTAKALLRLRLRPPLCQQELERRTELALFYYAYLRPHQGLDGATPAEVFFRHRPAPQRAISPPRARPGEGPGRAPFQITYLDSERFFPVLIAEENAA